MNKKPILQVCLYSFFALFIFSNQQDDINNLQKLSVELTTLSGLSQVKTSSKGPSKASPQVPQETLSLRENYFYNIMGFYENELMDAWKNNKKKYNNIIKNCLIKKERPGKPVQFVLKNKAEDKKFQAGFFTNPTIIALREQAQKLPKPGNGEFNIVACRNTINSPNRVKVDVGAMQADIQNRDAVFQVASNFSALEPTSKSHVPESGITGYIYDTTQGPFASISTMPGLFYRMYGIFYNANKNPVDWRQTTDHQIELLGGGALYPELKNKFPVTNGYVDYAHNPGSLNLKITNKDKDEIRIGYHRDMQVTFGFVTGNKQVNIKDDNQIVNQVFTAALDLGSLNSKYNKSDNRVIERAKVLLDTAYEGTLLAAFTNHKKKVFLTLIGGGVFNNNISWIIDSIEKNINFIKDSGLDVTLIIWGYDAFPKNILPKVKQMVNNTKGKVQVWNGNQANVYSSDLN